VNNQIIKNLNRAENFLNFHVSFIKIKRDFLKASLLFGLSLLFMTVTTQAAVTVDAVSSQRDSALLGLNNITWQHTVGTGSERALYVSVSTSTTLLPVGALPSLLSVANVTYNGQQLTRVGSMQSPAGTVSLGILSKSYVEIFRLVNPPSGTANIVVNFNLLGEVPITPFVNTAVGGAVSYNGVSQTTPNGTFYGASGLDTTPSLTVNGATAQDLVMDVIAAPPAAEDFTAGVGQTLRWEGNFPAVFPLNPSFDGGAGSTKAGTGAPVSMGWVLENTSGWALGGLAIRASSNPPSVITVNTVLDNESNGCSVGSCTLREAIAAANSSAEPDTIVFAPGVTGTIALTQGQLVITSDMTITGPGARDLAVSGSNQSRVFLIATPILGGDFTVNISGLTITNGNATPLLIGSTLIGDGGGILNGALLGIVSGISTLNLTEVNVSGNSSTTLGGGIATRLGAQTYIERSLISNNQSNPLIPIADGTVGGGGIANLAFSTTTINNSTVTNNNSLAVGGGILNVAGTVNLTNDTISHNTSTLAGGGVVSLLGTIPPVLGVTYLRNTIIAKNNDLLATNILGRDVVGVLGSIQSLGNNLIGSNFGAEANLTASVFVGTTPQPNAQLDLVGGIAVGNQIINPQLDALQNNGGPTDTRLIARSSPALDAGNNCVFTNSCLSNPTGNNPSHSLTMEQRRMTRVMDGNSDGVSVVDIGAVELSPLAPTSSNVSVSGRVLSGQSGVSKAIVILSGADGIERSTLTNSFGYYSFEDVPAGETYIFQVKSKRNSFAPQILTVMEDITDLDFVEMRESVGRN